MTLLQKCVVFNVLESKMRNSWRFPPDSSFSRYFGGLLRNLTLNYSTQTSCVFKCFFTDIFNLENGAQEKIIKLYKMTMMQDS